MQCSTNAKSINIYNLKEDVWTMFQFRTLCNVAQTSAKRGQTLFEIVFSRSALLYDVIQKIEFEPENFEIFKTETVAQSQNLLARIYFHLVLWQC